MKKQLRDLASEHPERMRTNVAGGNASSKTSEKAEFPQPHPKGLRRRSRLSGWALARDQKGANLVEYLVVLLLVAIVAIVAFGELGTAVTDKAGEARDGIDGLGGG